MNQIPTNPGITGRTDQAMMLGRSPGTPGGRAATHRGCGRGRQRSGKRVQAAGILLPSRGGDGHPNAGHWTASRQTRAIMTDRRLGRRPGIDRHHIRSWDEYIFAALRAGGERLRGSRTTSRRISSGRSERWRPGASMLAPERDEPGGPRVSPAGPRSCRRPSAFGPAHWSRAGGDGPRPRRGSPTTRSRCGCMSASPRWEKQHISRLMLESWTPGDRAQVGGDRLRDRSRASRVDELRKRLAGRRPLRQRQPRR